MKTYVREMRLVRRLFIEVIVAIVVLVFGYVAYNQLSRVDGQGVRVAVLMAEDMPSHARVYDGMVRKRELLNSKIRYVIKPFLFRSQDAQSCIQAVNDISRWLAAVVVSVGVSATRCAQKKNLLAPLICADVCTYQQQCPELPGAHSVENGFHSMPALLNAVRPGTHVALIVYDEDDDAAAYYARCAELTKDCFTRYGIAARLMPLKRERGGVTALRAVLDDVDVVMTLEQNPLEEYAGQIAELCNETKTTFFCGGLAGVEAGAALSFGGHLQVLGKAVFECIHKIIEEQIAPAAVGVLLKDEHRQFVINTTLFARQGMQPLYEAAVRQRLLKHRDTAQWVSNLKIIGSS